MLRHTLSRAFSKYRLTMSRSLLVSAFIVIASLAVSAWIWLAPTTRTATYISSLKAEVPPLNSSPSSSPLERVEAEIITIRPTGFEPTEIKRPKGRFLLAVDNRAGLEEAILRLDRKTGGREREARVHRNKLDWRSMVDLPPGHYILTEANHPNWVCHIIISAN